MNPFRSIENIHEAYKSYVYTFQKFKNPVIHDWIKERLDEGGLLWKDPFIQLNRRFEKGDSLESFVESGILHRGVLEIFTRREYDKLTDQPIMPYKHQSDAIVSIMRDNLNTIITTGTSSGKSFCFGIPIVSECLKMRDQGLDGVKAIIVYPMNALANSQYEDFAQRLNGSGLKIALYTGDTRTSSSDALEELKTTMTRNPYDSEVLSREEIHANPPDILMTNYVMLDLILTRFEDRKIFPLNHKGVLRFLVLDEIHTYSGKRGADVACLIRRLKEQTGSINSLCCIGTSATIQSHANEDSKKLISQFGSKLFGEKFDRQGVIGETYVKPLIADSIPLLDKILVGKEMLDNFDGSLEKTSAIVSSLTGKHDYPTDTDYLVLGKILSQQKTAQFIQERLSTGSVSLSDIFREYRDKYRRGFSLDNASNELKAVIVLSRQNNY